MGLEILTELFAEIWLFNFVCRVCEGEFIVEAESKCGLLESSTLEGLNGRQPVRTFRMGSAFVRSIGSATFSSATVSR